MKRFRSDRFIRQQRLKKLNAGATTPPGSATSWASLNLHKETQLKKQRQSGITTQTQHCVCVYSCRCRPSVMIPSVFLSFIGCVSSTTYVLRCGRTTPQPAHQAHGAGAFPRVPHVNVDWFKAVRRGVQSHCNIAKW